jgi:hypothetical protein
VASFAQNFIYWHLFSFLEEITPEMVEKKRSQSKCNFLLFVGQFLPFFNGLDYHRFI